MAASLKFEEFNSAEGDIDSYIERLEQHFIALDLDGATEAKVKKQRAILLSSIGAEPYRILKDVCFPTEPSAATYKQITDHLKDYYSPKRLAVAERFKFHNYKQQPGQSITEYATQLKKLVSHCDFNGASLESNLRDRFICGLSSEHLQRKLLSEELDFKRAVQKALADEAANKNVRDMTAPSTVTTTTTSVNKVNFKQRRKQPPRHQKPTNTSSSSSRCFRCGFTNHKPDECKYKSAKCFKCGGTGHLKSECRSKDTHSHERFGKPKRTHYVETDGETQVADDEPLGMYTNSLGQEANPPIIVSMCVANRLLDMELDTGAACSVISEELYNRKFHDVPLQTGPRLHTYGGREIPTIGQLEVPVTYKSQEATLTLVVARGAGPALLGRNWLSQLKLDWTELYTVNTLEVPTPGLQQLLDKYQSLFEPGMSTIKGFKAHIRIKDDAQPIFFRARPVPYALRDQVEAELERLQAEGVISKVEHSEWASPIVVVQKANGKIRICGDYKVSVNKVVDIAQHPLPNTEDLFASLAGASVFSKLDLSHAFQQVELDEQSQKYLTINTHKGLFVYKKLPYGVSSAPALFQSVMDQMLHGLDNVLCRADDVLIKGSAVPEHLDTLQQTFTRLNEHAVHLNKDKCVFLQPSVEYMGHVVDQEGLHPMQSKIDAVLRAPAPTNITELRSYLGLLNYYNRFIPNMVSTFHPMYELLAKDKDWNWTAECQSAFESSKQALVNNNVVVHYDSSKPLKLACDSSSYGIGAVLSHIMDDGTERPVAFASRTLSKSEKNYAQVEKEALSLIFGVKKFHNYLYGREFTLITDHKPLTTILGPKQGVPTLAAARMQRWALILSAYQYNIEYRCSSDHANADALSRLPQPEEGPEETGEKVYHFSYLEDLPIDYKVISAATRKDPVLSRVLDFTMEGWPHHLDNVEMKPYFLRRNELSVEHGCILWGLRVVIPPEYRPRLLNELHEDHPGVVRMKSLARSYLWWPGIDANIEETVGSCSMCQSTRNAPARAPLHYWQWTSRPWQRVHVDFGQKGKDTIFVLIDSHSKWIEAIPMTSTTASRTIQVMRDLFCAYGFPDEVVSDNGPPFSSEEMALFMARNGIKHTLVPPYHPSSNGAAERAVQVVKRGLSMNEHLPLAHRLSNFLLAYRSTPHTVTGVSPAELFLKRRLRIRLSLLKPDNSRFMGEKQEEQKRHHDKMVKFREFQVGDSVRVKTHHGNVCTWEPGIILKVCGPRNYLARVMEKTRYVHIDHIRGTSEEIVSESTRVPPVQISVPESVYTPFVPTLEEPPPIAAPEVPVAPSVQETPKTSTPNTPVPMPSQDREACNPTPRRNPMRARVPPKRLDL